MEVFNLIPGWKRHHVADGVVIVPPEGMNLAAITIRQRVRPLRSLKSILDEAATRLEPELRAHLAIGAADRFVNTSGEYVALATMSSQNADKFFQQTTAMAIGDDWFVQMDGVANVAAIAPKIAEIVRVLATTCYTGLGELRRRPYLYQPPAGWHGVGHACETIYYGPRHPRSRAVMRLFHARPVKMTPSESQDRALHCETMLIQEKDAPVPAKNFTNWYGLYGEMIKESGLDAAGRRVLVYKTMLVDKRFMYLSRLDTDADESAAVLPDYLKVLERVVPVPLVPQERHHAVIHWSD
ncbi:MAG: hypothetical protein ACKV2T_20845 [Kofleriaceae bacterium]